MATGAAQIDDGAAVRIAAAIRLLNHQIEIVNDVLARQNPRRRGAGPPPGRVSRPKLGKGGRHAAHSYTMKALPVEYIEDAKGAAAQSQSLLQHRVEHWLEITGRCIDNLQDIGGRGLLLQCLTRLGHKQRILHYDHGLRCKSSAAGRSACRRTDEPPADK